MAPKKMVLGGKIAAQRRKARKDVGSLRSNRVGAKTIPRYLAAVAQFLAFLQMWAMPLALTLQEMDYQLQDFLEFLWERGA